jgi:membrane associated rhomboid family serine protease
MDSFIDSDKDSLSLTREHLRNSLMFPIGALLLIWAVHIFRLMSDIDPGDYGIIPRSMYGFRGIFTAPLMHGSTGHIASNSVPLLALGTLTFYFYQRVALRAFWLIYFLTGAAVWLFARPVSHIGASGVVYGLVAFLFWNGITRGSTRSVILSLMVLFFYSGMFVGILPNEEGVSWESHLLGSLSGIFAAFWYKTELEDEEKEKDNPFASERNTPPVRFLPEGIFEKTKAQRQQEAEEAARLEQEERERRVQEALERMRRQQEGGGGWPFWTT